MTPKFCCAQKKLFETNKKSKDLSPLKMYFAPPNSKTWVQLCLEETRGCFENRRYRACYVLDS